MVIRFAQIFKAWGQHILGYACSEGDQVQREVLPRPTLLRSICLAPPSHRKSLWKASDLRIGSSGQSLPPPTQELADTPKV